MLYKAEIAVLREICTLHINTLEHQVEFFNAEFGGK